MLSRFVQNISWWYFKVINLSLLTSKWRNSLSWIFVASQQKPSFWFVSSWTVVSRLVIRPVVTFKNLGPIESRTLQAPNGSQWCQIQNRLALKWIRYFSLLPTHSVQLYCIVFTEFLSFCLSHLQFDRVIFKFVFHFGMTSIPNRFGDMHFHCDTMSVMLERVSWLHYVFREGYADNMWYNQNPTFGCK